MNTPTPTVKEFYDYDSDDLRDVTKQKELFERMLRRLESDGHCRRVFHTLGFVLFGDEFEERF
jgi:hypothetical protein